MPLKWKKVDIPLDKGRGNWKSKQIDEWEDRRQINKHTNGWLDWQKDIRKNRWTESNSDRNKNTLMGTDLNTEIEK
jgi:hypothetical protein